MIEDGGSPPRVRGKHDYEDAVAEGRRITPARAGKTRHSVSHKVTRSDHPRACGENRAKPRFVGGCDGSPPRVRGKPIDVMVGTPERRITPARAGKTMSSVVLLHSRPDHPRACGENIRSGMPTSLTPGSPPRVRGKREMD